MKPMPDQFLERMRQLPLELDLYKDTFVGTENGIFMVRRQKHILRMISSTGAGWEHVSVSLEYRTPTWDEMCYVKDLFWLPEERVVQYHPPVSEYVNNHPYCLHLWRPTDIELPHPPAIFVGKKDLGIIKGDG